ncbi:MAG: biopolymer transporter ExbD [Spirochaetaceae bacterium]|nr:biopolymer transporter ExbD [Spirochaetaceae bacterium]MBO4706568.1 biopolymer transporter ExbD [Spirochaetaceae bacterium]
MRGGRHQRRPGAQVDLIPMIDIVFQLILFFLVSTTFALLPAITLKLPSSQTSDSVSVGQITITIETNGSIWLNSDKVASYGELNERLAAFDEVEYESRRDYPVQLEADELVTNGDIVRVFDILRKNGFAALNLRTTNPE